MNPLQYNVDEILSFANENDQIILEDLGLKVNRMGDVKGCCPIHDGDNPRGFSYCSKRKTWQCFTHLCHEKKTGNLIGLIQLIKNLSFKDSIEYVIRILNIDPQKYDSKDIQHKTFIKKQKLKSIPEDERPPAINKEHINSVPKDFSYFIERGIDQEILKKYLCFTCKTYGKPLVNRACFPIYDNGDILGFAGRTINNHEIKWLVYPSTIKGNYFFGMNIAEPHILQGKTVIIVEGPIDAIKLQQNGLLPVVSCLGNKLTKRHKQILLNMGVNNIIVLFDPDEGGQKGFENVSKNQLYFRIFNARHLIEKDPGDMDNNEIESLVKKIQENYLEKLCVQ